MISSRRSDRRALSLAAASLLALGGCAGVEPLALPPDAAAAELDDVPFFPQTDYQCGPAALATVLANAGVAVTPDELVDQVYVAGLHGSLQAELLGATRRHGLIAYVLAQEPAALLAELRAGKPVLVLENLGFERVPVWHYAVVVGYDPARDRVILRSGREKRRLERTEKFMRSWQRSDYWAFVPVAPGELPASATPGLYVRALAAAEPLLPRAAADAAFARGLQSWPDDELVLFASAGHELQAGDLDGAATLYERLLDKAPRHAAARNNLANVLEAQGCHTRGLAEARAALAAVPPGDALFASIEDTVKTLERSGGRGDAPTCR